MGATRLVLGALFSTLLLSACTETPNEPVEAQGNAVNGNGRLEVYNGGVDRAVPATPCEDALHRQFDFWVGEWRIGPTQRSLVRSLLDGCMIEENYMPGAPPSAPGAPPGPFEVMGRSINAYDRDTGKWHQTWVSVFPNGHLRMSGGLQGSIMVLGSSVSTPNGPIVTEYRWTPVDTSTVIQAFITNGMGNSLPYTRTTGVTLAPPRFFAFCQTLTETPNGGFNRKLDFLAGTWSVHAEHGPKLGTATLAPDLNGCLMREDYTTDKGFAAHSYIYYDVTARRFFRTYIDSEAERAELNGDFVDGALVLRGAEPGPGGKVFQVRNTIRLVDANTVSQLWETSEDGMAWTIDLALIYSRQ